jgi:acyl-CoA synthetase (AMP-forming)/AMP-acid ligase II
VPAGLLRRVHELVPSAELHTPYGMTEALPLTDVSLAQIEQAGEGDGVCVGRPLDGVTVAIAELDRTGRAGDDVTDAAGVSGEIWATAEHIRDRYDAAWVVDAAAAAHPGWHRTGDVGYLDQQGRLWVQGRTVHVITTANGPVTPVGIELRVQAALDDAGLAGGGHADVAVVGVGPTGTQQVVVVLAGSGGPVAPTGLTEVVRAAALAPIAAVLIIKSLPVDIRHNSKIDRVAVGEWAAKVLAGG